MKKGNRTQAGVTVTVKGKNMTVTAGLHNQVVHKMQRLDKYLDRLNQIEVELSHEHTRDRSHQSHVEATTHVLGRTIRVTADDIDMMAAVGVAVDKLYRQLNRTKERVKDHHGSKLAETFPLSAAAEDVVAESEELLSPTVHVERLDMKPKFEEEAIEEMEAQGRNFYVFLNARNEQVNVVYRRGDDQYGLISPRAS